ncbi:PAS/PAC sensor-containing diguanylate cyclase [Ectopseudomonas mendocina DLHK]|nr:PAS/PAC sensor-containing diguanylate cyclase [Pseudomonas mendocina DLHK]
MTLRRRLFSLFAPLLLLTLLLVQLLSNQLLLSRFDQQDKQRLQETAHRAHLILLGHIERTTGLLHSYAWWDPSYELAQGRGDSSLYLRQNLDSLQLANYDFDFMALFDDAGKLVLEQWAPPDLADLLPVGHDRPRSIASLRSDIYSRSQRLNLLRHQSDAQFRTGQVLLIQGVPVLLVSSAVSNSQGTASAVGTLLAGRFLDGQRLHALDRQLPGSSLRLLPAGVDPKGWQPLPERQTFTAELGPRRLLDEQQQQIELLLNNSDDEPELRLQLTSQRINYHKGKEAIEFFLSVSFLIALAAAGLVYLGLEYWVLHRLERLNREIGGIGQQARLPRVSSLGNDELGELAAALNQMLERLDQSEERDRAILESIQDGYFEVDAEGRFTRVNRGMELSLGYRSEELLNMPFTQLLLTEKVEQAETTFQQAQQDSSLSGFNLQLRRADGSLGDFEGRLSQIHTQDGTFVGYRGILRDISERAAHQRHLHDLAYRDPLTSLGNRKAFHEQLQGDLQQALNESSVLALFFIDLDHFKQVNDQYGHDAGDALLCAIAARLQHGLRQPGKLYRLGGDEFTLLMPQATAEAARALGERLLGSLGAPFEIAGHSIDFVTPSVGIALCPQHATDSEALIKAADSAMYQAKRKRNQVVMFEPSAAAETH